MLERLPASATARRTRPWTAAASVAIHAALIALAAHASGWSAQRATDPVEDVALVYHPPAPVRPIPTSPRRAAAPGPTTSAPTPLAPPLVAPIDVPAGIAPPDPGAPVATELSSFGPPAGIAERLAGAVGSAGTGALRAGELLDDRTVDRAVAQLPGAQPPRYAEPLRAAGIAGRVTVRFVVDTLGRVEPGSVRAIEATHPLFAREVERALAATRYVPAEARGRRVRQLVEQTFEFQVR